MKRLAAFLLCCPAPLVAQGFVVAPYVAQNRSLPGTPSLVGLSLGTYRSALGLRVGAGLGAGQGSFAGGTTGGDAWTADADLVLDAGELPGLGGLLGGFLPAAFVGVGAEGLRGDGGTQATVPLWSYGAIVGRSLFGGLGIETEARYRVPAPLENRVVPEGFTRGWEYRLGLSLRFGGGGGSGGSFDRRGSTPAPVRVPSSPDRDRPATRPASASARRILGTAEQYLGTRYVYGGTTPRGFDCSGFTQYVFRQQGVTLPRTSRQQATVGDRVSTGGGRLAPGDLMLFASNGSRVDHVAIYAGDNRIIHSTSSGGGVRYDDLLSPRGRWFVAHHVASRRVLADGRSLVRALDAAALRSDTLDPPDRAPRP